MKHSIVFKQLLVVTVFLTSLLINAQQKIVVSKNGEKNTYPTIYKALDDAAKKVSEKGYPSEGIEIIIKDGYYKIDKSILIGKQLSGSAKKPFVIKAENPSQVHFFGGAILNFDEFDKFNESDAGFKLNDAAAVLNIRVLDLKKAGIKKSELGEFMKHGYGFEKNPNFTTPAMLWVDGERMHLSRWPNVDEKNQYYDNVNQFEGKFSDVEITGAVSMVDVIDIGMKKPNMWFQNNEFLHKGGGAFSVAFDRGNSWRYYNNSNEKIWLDGVLAASWEWEYTEVKSIKNKEVVLASGTNRGIGFFKKVTHFHFENVPEELDSPGEYFIDRDKMLLYFYPPANIKGKTITLSTLSSDMVKIVGASNVKIDGIVFESGRENAIVAKNVIKNEVVAVQSSNIIVENCTIRNFNQWGILIQGPKNSKVNNCHIYNMGAGGVRLGNDAKSFSLIKENNVVSNCEIHHIAFDQKSQVPGITLAGCGNIARNNEIYNTPHFGIKMKFANDCIAENNFMHDLPEYHHFDGGALYLATGGQFYNRGNKIRNNYFKDIATNGAYLDNYTMGNEVSGNIFYNVGNSTKGSKNAAVYIHGGGQNIVENNITIDRPYGYKTGSHIVKASNTTNYLHLWYTDAKKFFKPNDFLYSKYVEKYPEMKAFVDRLNNSPKVIYEHLSKNTLKQISAPKNKKQQIEAYDLKGVKAFLSKDKSQQAWANWFLIRYQSTTFKNNAFCFTSEKYKPNLDSGIKGAFVLGGKSGVFEMSPYNLKENGKTKKITNHIFEGNKWLLESLDAIGKYSEEGDFIFNNMIEVNNIEGFSPIDFSKIGMKK
ncbi:MAG: right-handed parallel beta-helix repeat-containing protein [Bacteroidetes bacterium]|nr:right-handed parallel beta-helix repeat-containing protein [Bacteroidota bacterium]